MPGQTLAVVSLASTTGLPEDVVQNSIVVQHAADASASPGEISQQLNTFYDAIGSYLHTSISRVAGTSRVDLYAITGHLDGSPHGIPYFSDVFAPSAAAPAGDLPRDVAVCLTLKGIGRDEAPVEVADNVGSDPDDADTLRDRPMQRRTGRMYIGPFNSTALSSVGRPETGFMEDLRDAAEALLAGMYAMTDPAAWCVWSRKNAAVYQVVGGYIDNEFDTQRRRALAVTQRLSVFTP